MKKLYKVHAILETYLYVAANDEEEVESVVDNTDISGFADMATLSINEVTSAEEVLNDWDEDPPLNATDFAKNEKECMSVGEYMQELQHKSRKNNNSSEIKYKQLEFGFMSDENFQNSAVPNN